MKDSFINDEPEYLALLLQIIKVNGSVETIVKLGYNYSKIAESLNYLRQKVYIILDGDIIKLTAKGYKMLKLVNKKLGRRGISKWVSPKLDEKIPKMNKFDIYLPSKKIKLG